MFSPQWTENNTVKNISNKSARLLGLYRDGELNSAQRRRIERDLEQDASLQAEAEAMDRVGELLRACGPDEIPSSARVCRELRRRLHPENEGLVRGFHLTVPGLRPALVGAMALMLLAWGGIRLGGWRSFIASHTPWDRVEFVETELPGANPLVYADDESGWTVIWVVEDEEVYETEDGDAG